MPAVRDVIDFMEQVAPPYLAADWDNVGLLLGDRSRDVERIMTCLTITGESASEAIESKAQLIVSHHPILFRPSKRLTTDSNEGRILLSLIKAETSVYCPHTAFDNVQHGINDRLAGLLGATDIRPLRPNGDRRRFKVVVFVPDNDLPRVSDAMFAAGAGNIGQYSQCSFRLAGTGTFFGSAETNPAVGQKGRREEVSEWRLEAVCPQSSLEEVVRAIRLAHSYEEPAFDIYPLHPSLADSGEGRIGTLPQPRSLGELAQFAKVVLNARQVQVVGDLGRAVSCVAVACGAGGEFLNDAIAARADVFITGEMKFHDYLAARAAGIGLLLPGHYATERFGVEQLAARIQAKWPEVDVWPSKRESDPAFWI
jgi:dinuclear metal center YbgI/SA1388 family protein